ncbi:MAG TPA: hypothetical protein VGM88_30900 [Kofleriaceae bacterium]|jgi:hypothetical protein
MRALVFSLAAFIAPVAIAACGPSGQEMSQAKTARYHGDKMAIFHAAKDATEAKYKLGKVDEVALGFQTEGRWYTPEGLAASERNGDMRDVPDKSLSIVFVVRVLPDGDNFIVQVEPHYMRYFAGRPNPDVLEANDPSIPGFATGKVEALQYDIYQALKPYAVASTGGTPPPAPSPAPAAAPSAAPGATPPAEPAPPATPAQ